MGGSSLIFIGDREFHIRIYLYMATADSAGKPFLFLISGADGAIATGTATLFKVGMLHARRGVEFANRIGGRLQQEVSSRAED